jgi:hypothetical protein
MAPKKPVKRSGASTGGKVVSRVNEADSKNKQVPVTSVTPKATTAKASQKTMTGARKVVGAVVAATPVGRAGKAAATAAKKASDTYSLGKIEMLNKELTPKLKGLATGKIKWESLSKKEQKKLISQSSQSLKLNMKFVDKK